MIEPHGLCAGVNAAVAKALRLKNVYCLHALVHNEIVTEELKALGYRFVERIEDVPVGQTVVFPAHGVSPSVRAAAARRRLKVVDTTCPFVARVHEQVRKFAKEGLPVVVIGDRNHDEVKGIVGENSSNCRIVESSNDSVAIATGETPVAPGNNRTIIESTIGVVSQTTMDADEVARIVSALRKKYRVKTMATVCRATAERQNAVRKFCRRSSVLNRAVLVLGSRTSANARRLREIAEAEGATAFLAGAMDEIEALRPKLDGFDVVGVTSGASTPERFFEEAVRCLRNVPRHVAVIMDGNGRWALQRGKRRLAGHHAGAKTLKRLLKWCGARGIRYLTVYAFSTENWQRPKEEVDGLMRLLGRYLRTEFAGLEKDKVRFRVVGRRHDLPKRLQDEIARLEKRTEQFDRQLIVALSYGGRAEIIDAVNRVKGPVTEETFRQYLYAPDVPDPDLVIRTSGEKRTSNFLLWETAYSEYHFSDVLWPDFSEADFDAALADYAARDRRHGGHE